MIQWPRRPERRRGLGLAVALWLLGCLVSTPPAQGQAVETFPTQLVKWQADPATPVFQGTGENTWDRKIRERGWILADGSTLHLFYTGYNDALSPLRLLGHATSTDGVTWERDPRNPLLPGLWVEDMCVVRDEARGRYVMFAEGEKDIAHALESTDLIQWKPLGPLDVRQMNGEMISAGPRGTPFVLRDGQGKWCLMYERGDQGVWLARSEDMQRWVNVRDEPVLAMGPDAYDRHAVAINQVIREGDFYYAFYHANATRPWGEWTTCIARSKDLLAWEKFGGNPIIADNRSSAIWVQPPGQPAHLYTMHPAVMRFSNPSATGIQR